MGNASENWVVGIDGGGTKTAAAVGRLAPGGELTNVATATAGPGNPKSVGWEAAQAAVEQAIHAACTHANTKPSGLNAICLALAGAARADDQERLGAWAAARFKGARIVLAHDALPVLVAGTQTGTGVALICGTGSIAFGRNRSGREARAGGWGYLFGDEGSGYAIAVAGLRAAAQATDGRGPRTRLAEDLPRAGNVADMLGLVSALLRSDVDRRTIARLAREVVDAADAGDDVARSILAAAARELAQAVAAVARRLDWSEPTLPLAFAGGLLLNVERLRTSLLAELTTCGWQAGPVGLVAIPALGAMRLAAQSLERD